MSGVAGTPPGPRGGPGGGGRPDDRDAGGPGRLPLRHPAVWRIVALVFVAGLVWFFSADGRQAPLPVGEDPAGEAASTWADADWDIFTAKVRTGLEAGWDTLPVNTAMARLGETFVGTAYVPKTLDPEGPERLVINFRGLDCVTFVETVFSVVRFLRFPDAEGLLADRPAAEDAYEELLAGLRYREGVVDGYASRLHYFSEWLSANAGRGLVRPLTRELGGARDDAPLDFMSTHPDAYRQLADSVVLERIRAMEARLSETPRWVLPEAEIAAAAAGIESGDIIAATSTVDGLDVAHTGLALWQGGTLRLLHAPLVGEEVQISERSLAERIVAMEGQDGIMVARPLPSPPGSAFRTADAPTLHPGAP